MFAGSSPIRSHNASVYKEDYENDEGNITHPKIRSVETLMKLVRVLRGRMIHTTDTTSEVISVGDSSDSEPRKVRRSGCRNAKKRKRLERSIEDTIIRERDELRKKLEEANLRIYELGGNDDDGQSLRGSVGSASPRKNYPRVEDVMETFRHEPIHALEAALRHQIGMVQQVARKSSRLKGTMAKSLYMAVVHMQAGVSEYVRRAVSSPKFSKEAE